MRIGMIGLGRMGANMAERLREHGHEVVGYDRHGETRDVSSLAALVEALGDPLGGAPRVVWIMVPAGPPVDGVLDELAAHLAAGDIVVEGGNSSYLDSIRRGQALAEHNIGFVDAGVSGGIWGRQLGYCLMVGGETDHVAAVQPAFDALAPDGGFVHAGPLGAGHFTKMVHNGVEYALMEAYAEGYELLHACDLIDDADAAVRAWRHGSVVRSWLLDLLDLALDDDPGLSRIQGHAADSGHGRGTVHAAVELGVPVPAISAALFARFASQQEDSSAMRVIAALRHQFGGHAFDESPPPSGGTGS